MHSSSEETSNYETLFPIFIQDLIIYDVFVIDFFRSRSLCDLSHSGEEIKIRTEMLQCSVKEADEEAQQIFDEQAETLYECTGKRQSLQSLTQK